MDWLRFNSEDAAFVAYLLCLALFAAVEWMHPAFSADARRHDRWPTNFGIGIFNIGLSMVAPVTAVLAAQWAKSNEIGLLNFLHTPFWLAALTAILVSSLAGYLLHVAE